MTTLTEARHAAEFLLSEADAGYSRDVITVVTGAGSLKAGAVLGKITASGKYKLSAATGADGAQVASAILLYDVDATAADAQAVVISRLAQVNTNIINYDATVDDGTKRAAKATQLAAVGILVR